MNTPLLIDLYQLTMAYGYWKLNMHEREAVFHLMFRKQPFRSNYTVACGLASVIEFLENWRFLPADLAYLETLKSPNGTPLFSAEFLNYLGELEFSCDLDAILEGNIVFPQEPLIRIKGPLVQGQLLESALLNMVNFQTLIATKAARIHQAAQGEPVLEFGLRRAQGPDGALSASRAAYIGGCTATSNVLAGKLFDIPVVGTHAHSWVTAFPDELSSFAAYASVMPDNGTFLVDTYDTLQGVHHAIEVGHSLRQQGAELRGIRLDSGNLAELSIKARQLLDEAGFTQTKIIASNNLDEYVIEKLKQQNAAISVWGVGTHLVTAYDHPALDGIYKLSALRHENGDWQYKLKLSEQVAKISNPGIHQVRRFFKGEKALVDVLYDIELDISGTPEMMMLDQLDTFKKLSDYDTHIDLLRPIFRKGHLIYAQPSIHAIRENALKQENIFIKMHHNEIYSVGLEKNLHELKQKLIADIAL